jgi:hypothetical protein
MIARAGGSWPHRNGSSRPITGGNGWGGPLDGIFVLLDRVVGLTRESVASFAAGASDDGLALLDRRDPLFEQAVRDLGELTRARPQPAIPLTISQTDLERLSATASEIGRLDAVIMTSLGMVRDPIAQELGDWPAPPTYPAGHFSPDFSGRTNPRG